MRVKEPSARQIRAAQSVLAYFAVMYDAGSPVYTSDEPRALAYAQAVTQLESELVRGALRGVGEVMTMKATIGSGHPTNRSA